MFCFVIKIYALQAEALLKLHKHQGADETLKNGPNFDVDETTRFFGPIGNANLLVVRAQVNLACGRLVLHNFWLAFNDEIKD